jgi:hypothetical protein
MCGTQTAAKLAAWAETPELDEMGEEEMNNPAKKKTLIIPSPAWLIVRRQS